MSIKRFPTGRLAFISVRSASSPSELRRLPPEQSAVEPAIYTGSVATENQLSSTGLQVVSLNMAREERLDRILRDLTEAQDLAGTDVWLLQEAVERPASTRTIADLAHSLNLNYVFVPVDFFDGGNLASGLAVLSRHPILEPRIIPLRQHNVKFNIVAELPWKSRSPGRPDRCVSIMFTSIPGSR